MIAEFLSKKKEKETKQYWKLLRYPIDSSNDAP